MKILKVFILSPGLSNNFIDDCYALALEYGATAGKITGAGGGGFLLLYCQEHAQDAVTKVLEDRGLKRMSFRFDQEGTAVVLNTAQFSHDWVTSHVKPQLRIC